MRSRFKASASGSIRRPTVVHLVCAAALLTAFVFVFQSSFFAGNQNSNLNRVEVRVLSDFQSSVQQCVVSF
ncbi:hypothetical protein CRG98_050113 [Punica granatum]|uniref:Uncharacterized protein n=1 Tax=Punica granatum TaxID=22663 RepID=A0A2I0GTF9_PUNGR|nr:hypothetical protein CRG98_050113 [Punica granatum]